jgi:hypothetical protein
MQESMPSWTKRSPAMRARTWIGALVVLVAIVAAMPLVTGRLAESRLRELVAAANQASFSWTLEVASYDPLVAAIRVRPAAARGREPTSPKSGRDRGTGRSPGSTWRRGRASSGWRAAIRAFATATHAVALDQSLRVEIATPPIESAIRGLPRRCACRRRVRRAR